MVLVTAGYACSSPFYYRDVWKSSDALAWTQVTSSASFPARFGLGCVTVGSQVVLVGGKGWSGGLNDVWVSTDTGSSWAQMASGNFTGRMWHGMAVFLSKLWVVGGVDGSGSTPCNDVWHSDSTTLESWVLATANAFPSGRYKMGITVHNARMWVASGYDGFGLFHDVCLKKENRQRLCL